MAHVSNKGFFMLDADASPAVQPTTTGAFGLVAGTAIIYWHQTGTTWNRINLAGLSSADGNNYVIARGNATAGVAPSAGEAASPVSGDTANVYLNNGQMEYWAHDGTSWVLGYTLTAQQLSDALVTLTGVAATSTTLGTFTGTTIADNLAIKPAIQALETELEKAARTYTDTNSIDLTFTALTGTLTAAVKRSATQNNIFTITEDTDGLDITTNVLPTYNTHALATADAGLEAGSWYALTVANLEGVASNGKGPSFRKS